MAVGCGSYERVAGAGNVGPVELFVEQQAEPEGGLSAGRDRLFVGRTRLNLHSRPPHQRPHSIRT